MRLRHQLSTFSPLNSSTLSIATRCRTARSSAFCRKVIRRVLQGIWVVLLATVVGCGDYDVVEEEVDLGFRGKAKSNPFLAAARFLTEMGLPAHSHRTVTQLPDISTIIIMPLQALPPHSAFCDKITQWVVSGGHLVLLLDPGSEAGSFAIETAQEHPLLKWSEIELYESEDRYVETWALTEDGDYHLNTSTTLRIRPRHTAFTHPIIERDGQFLAGTQYEGSVGTLHFIADGALFKNDRIDASNHAMYLWSVCSSHEGTHDVWIVYGTTGGFFSLLWSRYWMLLVSAGFAVFFYLWSKGSRFGPLLLSPSTDHRQFAEHVRASGRYFVRHALFEALVDPIRRRVRDRLHRHLPGLDSSTRERQVEVIADYLRNARTDSQHWEADDVRLALYNPPTSTNYVEILRKAQELDQQL